MIYLMLHHPCVKILKAALLILSFFIHVPERDVDGAFHHDGEAGQAEASFFLSVRFLSLPEDLRIDENGQFAIDRCEAEGERFSDLRSRNACAVFPLHGGAHIGDELEDGFGDFGHLCRFLPEDRIIGAGLDGEGCHGTNSF